MFLVVDEQRDKVRKAHVGKEQIVDTITQFQRFVDLPEERDHFVAAPDGAGFKMFLDDGEGIETGQGVAAKMQPVDGPGIILAAAVGVFDVLRKDKTLTGRDLVFFVTDLVEAVTIDTIKEKVFGQAFFSIGVVARRPWIVAEAADVHLPQENIVLDAAF